MLNDAATRIPPQNDVASRYMAVRALSLALTAALSDADATAQSMADASPAKWHLAHTTWFFETFVLRDHVPGYHVYDERWAYLFNSYYEAEGARLPRCNRGLLTRPTLAEIRAWRAIVDHALVAALPLLPAEAIDRIELGLLHEQQHQELLLTDILNLFSTNPLLPALWDGAYAEPATTAAPVGWIEGGHGITEIGADVTGDHCTFDCETPRHPVLLARHALATRCVTNAEWQDFIADGGYARPELWLSDGWAWAQMNTIAAPLYWQRDEAGESWRTFTLNGPNRVQPFTPVSHISYFEADAYARWAGARLPTEAEWESSAARFDPASGNQLDGPGVVRPRTAPDGCGLHQMFGDVWEWTGSAYLPYPGFRPAPGAIGEYNGKFMSGQFVLKGGSCATPRGHVRASYRNFFYPHQRWQFTGLRLARDV